MFKSYKEFKNNRKKYKGFTLIELLAVLLILFIVFSIVIYSFTDVFKSANETITKAEENIILSAAYDYALEYRGEDTWVEEVDKDGNVYFCVSLDSLINYGYFKDDGSNFEKYKDDRVVEFSIVNGVYNYKFISIDESKKCKFLDFNSDIVNKDEINTVIKDHSGSNVGEFNYNVEKINEKNYSFDYGIKMDLLSYIRDVYVTFVMDRSWSMSQNADGVSRSRYDIAIDDVVIFSNNLINNSDIDARIALISFDQTPKISRIFEKKVLSKSNFEKTGDGTNLIGGLDMAISLICHSGLDMDSSDSQWCTNIGGSSKKKIKLYTVVIFDGDSNFISRFDYEGITLDGKYINENPKYKETFYREFRSATLVPLNSKYDSAMLKDFYDNYLVPSSKRIKDDLDSDLFLISYYFASGYGEESIRKLASFDKKLCDGGNGSYCFYDSKADNLSSILEKISNNIVNDSKISTLKFIFTPKKKDGEDVITMYNKDGENINNNILEIKYENLDSYEINLDEEIKGYSFKLNDVVYNYCNAEEECNIDDIELFDVKMVIDNETPIVINSPKFNFKLTKFKTIN